MAGSGSKLLTIAGAILGAVRQQWDPCSFGILFCLEMFSCS